MSWSQVPDRPGVASSPPVVAAWSLATVPLLVGFADPTSWRWWQRWALPICIVHAIVLALAGRRPRWLLPSAVLGVVVLAAVWHTPSGVLVAGVGGAGTLLWAWGLGAVAPPGRSSVAAIYPSTVAAVLAAVLLALGSLVLGAAVLVVGLGLLVLASAWPAPMHRAGDALEPAARQARSLSRTVSGGIRRAAALAGRLVSAIVMVPVAVVVTVTWLLQRALRVDPLRSAWADDSEWTVRRGDDLQPLRAYSGAGLVDDRPASARLARLATSAVALVLLAGGTVLAVRDRGSDPIDRPGQRAAETGSTVPSTTAPAADGSCSTPPSEPILAAQPQAVELSCERLEVFAHAEYRASTGVRLADHAGKVINVADGVRRTWRPPACSCRRLTVWWLGGSAAWGEGQRDLYTLPSMVAKRAWTDGVALDIENLAMPTYTFNQEVHRLAELTATDPAPDLIVSYGGGNDLVFQALRASRGRADDASDIALLEQTFDDVVRHGIPVDPSKIEWTPDPQAITGAPTADLEREVEQATVDRYRRNLDLAERLARSIDRPLAVAWQPLLAGSSDEAGQPGVVPEEYLRTFTEVDRGVRDRLPASVIDLGGTFEHIDHPVFFDLFHTGEEGAAIVADSLYEALGPSLRDAARQARARGD